MKEAALTVEEYVAAKGDRCPACGEVPTHIWETHHRDAGNGMAEIFVECSDCGAQWTIRFQLVGYTGLEMGEEE